MQEAGQHLNLKKHVVGRTPSVQKELYAPVDIEVHHGKDNRFYVLDTARVFPPVAPNQFYRGIFIPKHDSGKGSFIQCFELDRNKWRIEAEAMLRKNEEVKNLVEIEAGLEAGFISLPGLIS